MTCQCGRPALGRFDSFKRLVAAFRSISLRQAAILCNNIGEAVVLYGFPCRAALIDGVESSVRNSP